MPEPIEPVKVEAYQCPVCEEIVVGNYEKARTHANLPVISLPYGLVFYYPCQRGEIIHIIDSRGTFNNEGLGDFFRRDKSPHSKSYSVKKWPLRITDINYDVCRRSCDINSEDFVKELIEGAKRKQAGIRLCTPGRFERIEKILSPELIDGSGEILVDKLIRTTPELEALVASVKR